MLQWAFIFLAITIVAAVLRFGGIVTGATVLFFIFLAGFVIMLLAGILIMKKIT